VTRSNVSIAFYLCLVFLSGVLVGGVGLGLYSARSSTKGDPCGPDAVRQRYRDDLRSRLQLRPDQLLKLDGILEETHQRFRAMRDKYRPEVKTIQAEQAESIRAMLDDRQKTEYEKLRQEREKLERERQAEHARQHHAGH
jgi:hypothetical protein